MNTLEWANADTGTLPPSDFYCETVDVEEARIEKIRILLINAGWSEDNTGLIVGTIGEIAGNCFAHNLGNWKDIPGCWLEVELTKELIHISVADRGQGVLTTLR